MESRDKIFLSSTNRESKDHKHKFKAIHIQLFFQEIQVPLSEATLPACCTNQRVIIFFCNSPCEARARVSSNKRTAKSMSNLNPFAINFVRRKTFPKSLQPFKTFTCRKKATEFTYQICAQESRGGRYIESLSSQYHDKFTVTWVSMLENHWPLRPILRSVYRD